jgi:hypothetical protein
MTHLDLAQPVARPLVPLKAFLATRMTHIRQMLMASCIASATIIVVAAVMMTAF